jgi:hypothetical protein
MYLRAMSPRTGHSELTKAENTQQMMSSQVASIPAVPPMMYTTTPAQSPR